MSSFIGFGFVAAFAGSAAIGATRKILERRRARQLLRAKPPLTADSPEGVVVRATGVVRRGEETLVAPLSGRECVVVRSRVRAGRGVASRAAVPAETMQMAPFFLDRDDGSVVRIEGKHVLLDVAPLSMPGKRMDRERRLSFLALHGFARTEYTRAVFDETLIVVGQRVSIAGLIMKDPITEATLEERGFRDAQPTSLRLAGDATHPLVIGEPVD